MARLARVVGDVGELGLIRRIREQSRSRNAGVKLGIGDDCAVLAVPPGCEMVVTTDWSLEGRHFRRDWHSPESVGHRCLARGLSDIAAMGAQPFAAFLSLALPRAVEVRWVDGFLRGLGALGERFGVELAGGDTAEAAGAEICADIVVVGAVEAGRALRRTGAKVGDGIYCTGSLGGAAVELARLAAGRRCAKRPGKEGAHPHAFPEPRVRVGTALLGVATSCMDLSDGLAMDLPRLCEASAVGAEIESRRIPLARGATLEQGLCGGEDYELLFTARDEVPEEIAGTRVTRVGTIAQGIGVRLDGRATAVGGWEHLRAERQGHLQCRVGLGSGNAR